MSLNKRIELHDRLERLMHMVDPLVEKEVNEKEVDEKIVKLLRILRDRSF